MQITIKGKDVSDLYLQQMQGKITRAEFIQLAGLDEREEAIHLALYTQDILALRRLAVSATDEEEHRKLIRAANQLDNADWAHDRAKDNEL